MGLFTKKCAYCHTKSPAKDMSHKMTWRGTYKWFHPACAAAAATEKRQPAVKPQSAGTATVVPVAASVVPATAPSPRPQDAVEFEFPADVVFRAAAEGIPTLNGFNVEDANPIARPRRLSVATKTSWRSLGEKVTVSVSEVTPQSASMLVESAAKTILGKPTGSSTSKNLENIEQIIRAISDQLDQNGIAWTQEIGVAPVAASEPESQSIEDRLRRLDALHELGLINQDDFETRKQAILSEL